MQRTIQLFLGLIRTSIKDAFTQKRKAWTEIGLVFVNNLLFFFLWKLFFLQFSSLGDWTLQEMSSLLALSSGSYGLLLILFGGVKRLPFLLHSGKMRTLLAQPYPTLLSVLGSQSLAKGWGHLATAPFLVSFCSLSPLLLLVLPLTCLALLSFTLLTYSLSFWHPSLEEKIGKFYECSLLFSLYPAHLFTGIGAFFLTPLLLPSWIGTLSIECLVSFSLTLFLSLTFGLCSLLCLSYVVFQKGLSRYLSQGFSYE